MELVYIFCNPLLHNIIQVKCLTLFEYASVKVISLNIYIYIYMTPHLTPYVGLGRHIDDMIIAGNNEEAIVDLEKYLSTCFRVKDLGPLKYFLGIEVSRSKYGISIC